MWTRPFFRGCTAARRTLAAAHRRRPFPEAMRSYNSTVTASGGVDNPGAPLGLPPRTTIGEYRANSICALSWFDYKVDARIGPSIKSQQQRLTVIDTGAGPNLIERNLSLGRTRHDRQRN